MNNYLEVDVKNLIFVFDRIPDNEGCNFIEVENESGDSVCAGEWRLRDDGLAELVVPVSYGTQAETLRADTAEAERRVSDLAELLKEAQTALPWVANSDLWERIDAALNPKLRQKVMSKFIWILRAALYMRNKVGGWGYSDLRFCWQTADVCHDNMIEFDNYMLPKDAIDDELSCWGE